jgi:competence protein ComEA
VRAWAVVSAVLLVRAFAAGMLHGNAADSAAVTPVVLDVNRASIGELTALPGIGRGRAESIVLHRVRYGPFRSVDDLAAVDGIGPETVAGLRQHARAGPVGVAR